jgi:TolB-like protein/Flp pilus assembly protein TadD/predicted Ser/Thr protein kinase
MIGVTVSRYRILSKLGGGGMGVVYEAEDTELGRRVAVKFLPEDSPRSSHALERFRREARAASALDHPHICVVYDVGSHEGQPFLVMERLKGRTLKHEIEARTLPIERVISLGEQIADALDAAHRAGILHRDLKPANLFVTERGEAKILDFGLAKRVTAASGNAVDAAATTAVGDFLTEAGATLGTVAYMSPEQARGQSVDARSDLFSIGVVLYEMATGRRPFEGQSTADYFAAILTRQPVPPRQLNPEIPARLEETILKALEKDPALRHQSAAGLRGDLLRVQRDEYGGALAAGGGPVRRRVEPSSESVGTAARARRGLRLGGLAAAVAALAWVGYFLTRAGGPAAANEAGTAPAAPPTAVAGPDRSIAVLPFMNLSPAKDEDYFSDGISEELLNVLSRIPELRVTARTSAFAFKGKGLGLPEIARRLRVAYVLEGSVRRAGDQVRISAQLVDATTETQLWSATYDRAFDDIFAIQEEIASDVVEHLQVKLLAAPPVVRKTNPEAYVLYLQARRLGMLNTREAFEKSDALHRRVLELDPDYAPAWDSLAANADNETRYGLLSHAEGAVRVREALSKALASDPSYAPAHARMGLAAMNTDRDLAAAASHLRRALSLAPTDLTVIGNCANLLQALGRNDDALAVLEAVHRRDPVNLYVQKSLGYAQRFAGRFDDAIASYRMALSLSPGQGRTPAQIGIALLLKGDAEGALAAIEQEKSEAWRMVALPMALHALGRRAEADAATAALIAKYERDAPYNIAYVHAFRGDGDSAFAWLDKAVEYDDHGLAEVVVDNLFASLHADPRWLPFLRRIGRAPEQLASIEFDVTPPK